MAGTISFSGISASGIDTSAWVDALVSVKQQTITTLQEQQEAQEKLLSVVNEIKTFFTSFQNCLSKITDSQFGIPSMDLFLQNLAISSNTNIATATATTEASRQSYDVLVDSLATATRATSGRTIYEEVFATLDTKLGLLGAKNGTITVNSQAFSITTENTIRDLISKFKEVGVSSNFDEEKGTFTVSVGLNEIDEGATNIKSALKLQDNSIGGAVSGSLVYVTRDTEFSKLKLTAGKVMIEGEEHTISQNGNNYSISKVGGQVADLNTVGDFFDYLMSSEVGAEDAKVDGIGNITIKGATLDKVEGGSNILDVLNLTETQNRIVMESGKLTYSQNHVADLTTKLSDLGINNDTELVVAGNANNITSDMTLGDVKNIMNAGGVDFDIDKTGVITVDTKGNEISGTLLDALGLDPSKGGTTITSSPHTARFDADGNTLLSDLGIDDSMKFIAYKSDGTAISAEISGLSNKTVDEFIADLKDLGLDASFDSVNHQIKIDNGYIEGTVADALGMSSQTTTYTEAATLNTTLEKFGATGVQTLVIDGGTTKTYSKDTSLNTILNDIIDAGAEVSFKNGNLEIKGVTLGGTLPALLGLDATTSGSSVTSGALTITTGSSSSGGDMSETVENDITLDSKIGDILGTTIDYTLKVDNGNTVTYTKDTTLATLKNQIETAGGVFKINDDNTITIDGVTMSGTLVGALGFDSVDNGTKFSTVNPIMVSGTSNVATGGTTLGGLGIVQTTTRALPTNMTLKINGGQEIVYDASTTLDDIFADIIAAGGTAKIDSEGYLEINGVHLEGTLVDALGLKVTSNKTTITSGNLEVTTSTTSTSSSSLYGKEGGDITWDSTIGSIIGDNNSYSLSINGNNKNYASNTKLSDIKSVIEAAGGSMTINSDNTIDIQGVTLSGTLFDALGFVVTDYKTVISSNNPIYAKGEDVEANENTKFSDLGISADLREYEIYANDGSLIKVTSSAGSSGDSTIGDWLATLNNALNAANGTSGQKYATINNGIISITGGYITGALPTALDIRTETIVTDVTMTGNSVSYVEYKPLSYIGTVDLGTGDSGKDVSHNGSISNSITQGGTASSDINSSGLIGPEDEFVDLFGNITDATLNATLSELLKPNSDDPLNNDARLPADSYTLKIGTYATKTFDSDTTKLSDVISYIENLKTYDPTYDMAFDAYLSGDKLVIKSDAAITGTLADVLGLTKVNTEDEYYTYVAKSVKYTDLVEGASNGFNFSIVGDKVDYDTTTPGVDGKYSFTGEQINVAQNITYTQDPIQISAGGNTYASSSAKLVDIFGSGVIGKKVNVSVGVGSGHSSGTIRGIGLPNQGIGSGITHMPPSEPSFETYTIDSSTTLAILTGWDDMYSNISYDSSTGKLTVTKTVWNDGCSGELSGDFFTFLNSALGSPEISIDHGTLNDHTETKSVYQLKTTGYEDPTYASKTTTVKDLGYNYSTSFVVTKSDGSKTTLSFSASDTIGTIFNKLAELGINASIDSSGRITYQSNFDWDASGTLGDKLAGNADGSATGFDPNVKYGTTYTGSTVKTMGTSGAVPSLSTKISSLVSWAVGKRIWVKANTYTGPTTGMIANSYEFSYLDITSSTTVQDVLNLYNKGGASATWDSTIGEIVVDVNAGFSISTGGVFAMTAPPVDTEQRYTVRVSIPNLPGTPEKDATTYNKISDLGLFINPGFNVTNNGSTTTLSFSNTDTISTVLDKLNALDGVTATFVNSKLEVTSTHSDLAFSASGNANFLNKIFGGSVPTPVTNNPSGPASTTAKLSTKVSELFNGSTSSQTLTLRDSTGATQDLTFSASNTIQDIIDKLASKNITATLSSDGKFTVESDDRWTLSGALASKLFGGDGNEIFTYVGTKVTYTETTTTPGEIIANGFIKNPNIQGGGASSDPYIRYYGKKVLLSGLKEIPNDTLISSFNQKAVGGTIFIESPSSMQSSYVPFNIGENTTVQDLINYFNACSDAVSSVTLNGSKLEIKIKNGYKIKEENSSMLLKDPVVLGEDHWTLDLRGWFSIAPLTDSSTIQELTGRYDSPSVKQTNKIVVTNNGQTQTFSFNSTDTIKDVIDTLNSLDGVNAKFESGILSVTSIHTDLKFATTPDDNISSALFGGTISSEIVEADSIGSVTLGSLGITSGTLATPVISATYTFTENNTISDVINWLNVNGYSASIDESGNLKVSGPFALRNDDLLVQLGVTQTVIPGGYTYDNTLTEPSEPLKRVDTLSKAGITSDVTCFGQTLRDNNTVRDLINILLGFDISLGGSVDSNIGNTGNTNIGTTIPGIDNPVSNVKYDESTGILQFTVENENGHGVRPDGTIWYYFEQLSCSYDSSYNATYEFKIHTPAKEVTSDTTLQNAIFGNSTASSTNFSINVGEKSKTFSADNTLGDVISWLNSEGYTASLVGNKLHMVVDGVVGGLIGDYLIEGASTSNVSVPSYLYTGKINKPSGGGGSTNKVYVSSLTDFKAGDTYYLKDSADLNKLAELVNSDKSTKGVIFILENDIDMSGVANFTPIGNGNSQSNTFMGTFYGNGHIIKNLTINSSSGRPIGLFGQVQGATIEDLGLTGVNIVGSDSVGALIGTDLGIGTERTTVKNVFVNGGTVKSTSSSGTAAAGGLIGWISSGMDISYSYADVDVTSGTTAGGLLGHSASCGSTIDHSFALGNVTSTGGNAGGLVGTMGPSSKITNSYAMGDVVGTSSVGGLAGYLASATVEHSYSIGNVSGGTSNGGFVGTQNSSTFTNNAYNSDTGLSAISGLNNLGINARRLTELQTQSVMEALGFTAANGWSYTSGLTPHFGNMSGTIGSTTTVTKDANISTTVGQLFGDSNNHTLTVDGNNITFSSSDTIADILNKLNEKGIKTFFKDGKISLESDNTHTVTGELASKLFGNSSFDLDSSAGIIEYITNPTTQTITSGAQKVSDVTSFTSGNTYLISDASDLNKLASLVNSGQSTTGVKFILTNDIDMSGVANFTPIGNASGKEFSGEFYGNGHVIKNLKITSNADAVGLFGYVGAAKIQDLGVVNIDITVNTTSSATYVGGLVGRVSLPNKNASITNSFVSGGTINISSTQEVTVGGLAGYYKGTVKSSYAELDINISKANDLYAGGLLGSSRAAINISDSYSAVNIVSNNVTNKQNIGGIAGNQYAEQGATINRVASFGSITNNSNISNSYIGGFYGNLGNDYGNITTSNSYSLTKIISSSGTKQGFVGKNSGGSGSTSFSNNFYSTDDGLTNNTISGISGATSSSIKANSSLNHFDNLISIGSSSNSYTMEMTGSGSSGSTVNHIMDTTTKIGDLFGDSNSHTFTINGEDITLSADKTIQDLINALKGKGYIASVNDGKFTIGSNGNTSFKVSGDLAEKVLDKVGVINSDYVTQEVTLSTSSKIKDIFWDSDSHDFVVNKSDGTKVTISLSGDDTIQTLIDKLKQNGIAASIDSSGMMTFKSNYKWTASGDLADLITQSSEMSMTTTNLYTYETEELEVYTGHQTVSQMLNSGQTLISGNRYHIASVEDLKALATFVNERGIDTTNIDFVLDGDIDLSSVTNFAPIGKAGNAFKGNFYGNGHVISNLTIDSTEMYVGLFGYTSDATIRDIGLKNVDVKGGPYTGALVGQAINNTEIINAYSTGNVSSASDQIGGLVGDLKSSKISNSYSSANVSGKGNIGGLIGIINDSTVENSYASGDVTASAYWAGGLAGSMMNGGNIKNAYATGNVNAKNAKGVGGLVGLIEANDGSSYNIDTVYSTGRVYGNQYTGALIGWRRSTSATISNAVYNSNLEITGVGSGSSSGIIGKTFVDMQNQSIMQGLGFTTDKGWKYTQYNTPYLGNITVEESGGSRLVSNVDELRAGDTYYIASKDDLIALANFVNGGEDTTGVTFVLQNDIDMSGVNFAGIATVSNTSFKGDFYGNGHSISNLAINNTQSTATGLFGYVEGAHIQDLAIVNANISGPGNVRVHAGILAGKTDADTVIENVYTTGSISNSFDVGGLVGSNAGSITKSFSTAVISGYGSVGGLVGHNDSTGTIKQSYATGNILSGVNTGGFVGYNNGKIETAYATGNVSGSSVAGSFVGINAGEIKNSYATGYSFDAAIVAGFAGSTESSSIFSGNAFNSSTTLNAVGSGASSGITGMYLKDMWDKSKMEAQGFTADKGWKYADETTPYLNSNVSFTNGGKIYVNQVDSFVSGEVFYIGNRADLDKLITLVNNGAVTEGVSFVLEADIDASGITSIGNTQDKAFEGLFYGNGHTISNLNTSLFGYVKDAQIQDVALENVNISSSASYVGALVGYDEGESTISNVYGKGSISGGSYVGGLVGSLGQNSSITESYSEINVSGSSNIGGLVGQSSGAVKKSYATGNITSTGSNAGGLIGNMQSGSVVDIAFATGTVNGKTNVGGLVGNLDSGSISNSYSTGIVSGTSAVGAFLGRKNGGTTTGNVYNKQAYTTDASVGSTALTMEEMQRQSIMEGLGFTADKGWSYYEGSTPTLRRKNYSDQYTIDVSLDTSLDRLGSNSISRDITVQVNGNTYQKYFNNGDTVEDVINWLNSIDGINAEFDESNSKFVVSSESGELSVTGGLANMLFGGRASTTTNTITQNTDSSHLMAEGSDEKITEATTISELLKSNNAASIGYKDESGNIVMETFDANQTLADVMAYLESKGFDVKIENGIFTAIKNDGAKTDLYGAIGSALKGSVGSTTYNPSGYISENLSSSNSYLANGSTKLEELGISSGNIHIQDSSGNVISSITIDNEMSINDVSSLLAKYGFTLNIQNGKVTVTADGENKLIDGTSDMVSKMKLDNWVSNKDKLTNTSTVGEMGFSSGASLGVVVSGKIMPDLSFTANDTLDTIIAKLKSYGINASVDSNGKFTASADFSFVLTGELGVYLTQNSLNGYEQISNGYKSENPLEFSSSAVKLTEDTLIGDLLGTGEGGILRLTIDENTVYDLKYNANDKVQDIIADLAAYGIDVKINDGVLTATSLNKVFRLSGDIGEALSGRTPKYEDMSTGYLSKDLSYKTTGTAKIDSSMKELGILAGEIHILDNNGDILKTLSVDDSFTIGQIQSMLKPYGFDMTIDSNGKVSITSNQGYILADGTSNMVSKMGLKNWNKTTEKLNLNTTISEMGFKNGADLNLFLDGLTQNILSFDANQTLQDIIFALSAYGINASVDANGQFTAESTNHTFVMSGTLGSFLTKGTTGYVNRDTG